MRISSGRVLGPTVRLKLTELARSIVAGIETRTGTRAVNLLEEGETILPDVATTTGIPTYLYRYPLPPPPASHTSGHLPLFGSALTAQFICSPCTWGEGLPPRHSHTLSLRDTPARDFLLF